MFAQTYYIHDNTGMIQVQLTCKEPEQLSICPEAIAKAMCNIIVGEQKE